jgi:hypothetical protein
MKCVELTVQFENVPAAHEPIERRTVEGLRAALQEALDATIRSFQDRSVDHLDLFPEYSAHLHSELEYTADHCSLVFQFRDAEPVRCRLFEQFVTDLIQCAASTYLLAGSGLSVSALVPHLYEERVLLFWGSFTRHAPARPLLTRLGLYSSSCRFEKTLDPAEYGIWVTNFDRLAGQLIANEVTSLDPAAADSESIQAIPGREVQDREARLSAVHEARDEEAFVAALREAPRDTLSEDEFLRLIRLALAIGAHRSARELAGEARSRFPEAEEIGRFAAILSRPEFTASRDAAPEPSDERAWVVENAPRFAGKWVALRGGDLLGSGSSLSEVRGAIGSLAGLFVTRIP